MDYTWNRKLGNIGKFSFTLIFGSIKNSKSKNKKNTWDKRNITLWCGLIRKIWNFLRFPSFRFGPINKIENSEISEKFCLHYILTGLIAFSVGKFKGIKTPYKKRALFMPKQYILNQQLIFIILVQCLLVRLFFSLIVSQSSKAPLTGTYFNLKARICKDVFITQLNIRWSFLQK